MTKPKTYMEGKDDAWSMAQKEFALQKLEINRLTSELNATQKNLQFQYGEKERRAAKLYVAQKELAFQQQEKEKRAAELIISNKERVHSELLLKNSLKEISDYKDVLDATTIIALTDQKGIIRKANCNFCKISKYKEAELVGQDHRILNSGYHSTEFMRDLWATITSGNIWKGELKNKAKDGSYYWVDTTIVPFLDEHGKPYQYLAIRVDISNRKESEEQLKSVIKDLAFQNEENEKRATELDIVKVELAFQNEEKEKRAAELVVANYARSLIEASLDPLFTISPTGKITDANYASVLITGVSRENLIGTDFFQYFTDPAKAREVYEQVYADGFVADYPLTMRDHTKTDVLFNGSVYKDEQGTVLGVVVVARDITEQKRFENELTEAKVFAENAVKAKQQFLSNMSHEIRTPMNAIIGFTKVVLKTELTAKQKEYLSAIKLSGDALIVLINDILDLAKVDEGKMSFEEIPFKLSASIAAMTHVFETKIQEKNLLLIKNYDNRIPEVLGGDPVRLHQIILNLLSNAVKFTSEGSITISVNLVSEDSTSVKLEFSVADTGIGIADAKIKKVFENFQQASSGTSRLYGGTGLGLAIVKQLVEQQGGTVAVQSTLNEGSVFSFELSFAKTNAQVDFMPTIEEFDTDFKNIKVLVVEDIALNQLLMKTLLDEFGFERDIADNGKVAIEMLKIKSYDIILMDLQMPEMNGFEATEYIRNTLHSRIPIIALTADVTTVDLAKCTAVGMNDYVAKPVDERKLYSKIINLVQKPMAEAEATAMNKKLDANERKKYTDLAYLIKRTKSDPHLMMEMISAYLEQTPPLVMMMKESLRTKDWPALQSAAHKMIPSFSIIGMSSDFEELAKRVQEYATTQMHDDGMEEIVTHLGDACTQACHELTEELNRIKSLNA